MKNILSIMIFAIVSCSVHAKQTYYYRVSKKIVNEVVNTNVSGGQFITFLSSVCYESDINGVEVGHGMLEKDKNLSTNSIITFSGRSYWDNRTLYRFSADYSKLNICLEDGTIFVYVRSTPPSGQTTCSLIRKKSQSDINVDSPSALQYAYPYNTNNGSSNSNSNTTSTSSQTKKWKTITRVEDCSQCHGSGKCSTCNGKGWYNGIYGPIDCPNCDGHKTGRCRGCHGSGHIEKYERVFE